LGLASSFDNAWLWGEPSAVLKDTQNLTL